MNIIIIDARLRPPYPCVVEISVLMIICIDMYRYVSCEYTHTSMHDGLNCTIDITVQ